MRARRGGAAPAAAGLISACGGLRSMNPTSVGAATARQSRGTSSFAALSAVTAAYRCRPRPRRRLRLRLLAASRPRSRSTNRAGMGMLDRWRRRWPVRRGRAGRGQRRQGEQGKWRKQCRVRSLTATRSRCRRAKASTAARARSAGRSRLRNTPPQSTALGGHRRHAARRLLPRLSATWTPTTMAAVLQLALPRRRSR